MILVATPNNKCAPPLLKQQALISTSAMCTFATHIFLYLKTITVKCIDFTRTTYTSSTTFHCFAILN